MFSLDIFRRRVDISQRRDASSCDIRLKIYKYHGGEKFVQIRILHVQ